VTSSDVDNDGDSISNNVDTQLDTFSDAFSDVGIGGTTSGQIDSRGDQTLTVSDEPNPAGIRIKFDPNVITKTLAEISACKASGSPASLTTLTLGDKVVITCGSITEEVIQGSVEIRLFGSSGVIADVEAPSGNSFSFDPSTATITSPAFAMLNLVTLTYPCSKLVKPY
jgi:hypothetical protein